AAERLRQGSGLRIGVVNARFVKPLDVATVLKAVEECGFVLTVEEGCLMGGFGSAVLEAANDAGVATAHVRRLGLPDRFILHAERDEQLAEVGLDVAGITRAALDLARLVQAEVPLDRAQGRALVEPLGELRHDRRHDRAQPDVEPEVAGPDPGDAEPEPAAVLDPDHPRLELHRCPEEPEPDVAHRHRAVVVDEPARDVLHRQAEGAAGVDPRPRLAAEFQADVRVGPGVDHQMIVVGLAGRQADRGIDVARADRVDRGPRLLPGLRQRGTELVVERQSLGVQVQVHLERVAGPLEPLDPAAAGDDGHPVAAAHVGEDPRVGVHLEVAGQVLDGVRQPGPLDRAPLVEVEVGVERDPALGRVAGAPGREPLDPRAAPDRPRRLELIDHRADVGGDGVEQRLVDRQRPPLELEQDVRLGAGVVDRAPGVERLVAQQRPEIDLDLLLLEGQPALDVVDRVLEVAVGHRDVAAIDRPAEPDRPPLRGADHVHGRADPPAGLEVGPELGELGRGPGAQPLVELQVDDVELEVERHPRGVAERQAPLGDADGRRAVVALGALDGDPAVADRDAGRQLVDREGELAAVPDARPEPRRGLVMDRRAGLGVVDELAEPEVDLAPAQADLVASRPDLDREPPAERLRDRQAGHVPPERDPAGGAVDRPAQGEPLEGVALGRALEPEPTVSGRLDPDHRAAEDRGGGPGVPVAELDGPVLDQDRGRRLDRRAGPRVGQQALEVPGPVLAAAEPERRLRDHHLAGHELPPEHRARAVPDVQPGDLQRHEGRAVDHLPQGDLRQVDLAHERPDPGLAQLQPRPRQVARPLGLDQPGQRGAVGHVGVGEPEPPGQARQHQDHAPEHGLPHPGSETSEPHRP
ncbi:MAG: hypothetical protein JO252_25315, partial [Planctomycetaceae bacterium]|nr:hypothetical protein [Planctomycetaceae bacterium]